MITVEEAKQELREYSDNIGYIREKQEDVEEIRELLVSTTRRLSATKTNNNSMSTDQFSDGLHRISEIEKYSDKKLAELMVMKFVVDEKIDKLKYPYRDVLFMRYSRRKSWQVIADALNFSYSYVKGELHGEALEKYAEL